MRIIGHGIDATSISAVKMDIDRPNSQWVVKCFSSDERSQASDAPIHYRYYAGRFAGKEAVSKALGTGFAGNITWRGIEILRNESGAPYVRLSGNIEQYATTLGITGWHISISYSGEIALASVIAVGMDLPNL